MALSADEQNDLVFQAKLAEQAERYDDMVDYMKKIAKTGTLQVEERNLLSVAYKNIVGARRAAWRVITSLLTTDGRAPMEVAVLKRYRTKVEGELNSLCEDILNMLKDQLIPSSTQTEERVFYLKMAGDYYRYLAELGSADEGEGATSPVEKAKEHYLAAVEASSAGYGEGDKGEPLLKTNPILLGLTLNFSVFYYEILGEPEKACELAKNGFDSAVDQLDSLEEDSYKDATLIMQLLRDNLTLWTSDGENFGDEGGDAEDM